MSKYYAVKCGRQPGIFSEWAACEKEVKGFAGAQYKSFNTRQEAENYLGLNMKSPPKVKITPFTVSQSVVKAVKAKSPQILRNNSKKFYAVIVNEEGTIYYDWPSCQKAIKGVPKVIFKGFATEKEAQQFIENSCGPTVDPNSTIIYTDGSGKGGFGIVILRDSDKYIAYGKLPFNGTNQAAELYAIYVALSLMPDVDVNLFTDSQYSIAALTSYFKDNKNVANQELLTKISELMKNRNVKYNHVYGHQGNLYNEECDRLARLGASNNNDLVIFKNEVRIR